MCEHCPERGSLCPNCGADPCYHLCFNSVAYYSPEQERADEPWYGMDDERERYAATAEPSQYADEGWREDDSFRRNSDGTVTLITGEGGEHTYDPRMLDVTTNWPLPDPVNDDDVPF